MSKFEKIVKNIEKRLNQSEMEVVELHTKKYVSYFLALMVPRLRKGLPVLKSWHQVQYYLEQFTEINPIVGSGFENSFSDGFMRHFEERYSEHKEEDYLFFLFKILRKYQSSTTELLADVLSLYEVDVREEHVVRYDYKRISKEG